MDSNSPKEGATYRREISGIGLTFYMLYKREGGVWLEKPDDQLAPFNHMSSRDNRAIDRAFERGELKEVDPVQAEGKYEAEQKALMRRMEYLHEIKESGDEHHAE